MSLDQEKRKKYLAKLNRNNIGKALFEEFDIEIENLKEALLEAESIEEVKGNKQAIQVIRNIKNKIEHAGRSQQVQDTQNEYA